MGRVDTLCTLVAQIYTVEQQRTKEFYEAKAKGKKVSSNFEYETPRLYVVEFDTGMTHEVMATSARDARLKTIHLQSDYGFYKTAYQK